MREIEARTRSLLSLSPLVSDILAIRVLLSLIFQHLCMVLLQLCHYLLWFAKSCPDIDRMQGGELGALSSEHRIPPIQGWGRPMSPVHRLWGSSGEASLRALCQQSAVRTIPMVRTQP